MKRDWITQRGVRVGQPEVSDKFNLLKFLDQSLSKPQKVCSPFFWCDKSMGASLRLSRCILNVDLVRYGTYGSYGRFHRGRELTLLNQFLFCFAVKPLNWRIYFQTFCNLVCVLINTKVRSSSFQFTKFTCEAWLKKPLNLASKYFFLKFGVFLGEISAHLEIGRYILDN